MPTIKVNTKLLFNENKTIIGYVSNAIIPIPVTVPIKRYVEARLIDIAYGRASQFVNSGISVYSNVENDMASITVLGDTNNKLNVEFEESFNI